MRESIWDRIEASRARHNVLEHPFYLRWSAGELGAEELARYSGQYRHATEAQEHIALWDAFVEAAGGEIGAEPHPETADCIHAWTERSDYLSALARLYAIESGQPEISRIKREGLAEFYGINGGPGSEYFLVHETMDEAHAEESRRLIESALEPGDEDAVVAAAESAFRANWRLLDGVS